MTKITRRALMKLTAFLGISLPVVYILGEQVSLVEAQGFFPTSSNRPIVPRGAAPEEASFIDPTVTITDAGHITLGQHVYIAPFCRLLADEATIHIGADSNAQDNVTIFATFERDEANERRISALGLDKKTGVLITERCVLAHGVTVKGPAQIGIGSGTLPAFLSFGAEVDGAILERNTAVSQLARVGPGVRLRSGFVVLPGKNVMTQEEADTVALGKVRLITEADIAFSETVVEVNSAFARVYTRLFYDNPSNIQGINYNPGHTSFNPHRHLPTLDGASTRLPDFPNRIIGAVDLADTLAQIKHAMGQRISLRADEGTPFRVGHIHLMENDVIFHALEHTDLKIGNNVTYGEQVLVHGGVREPGHKPTVVEDDVTLKSQSVIFQSLIGRGSTVGVKSLVVGSEVAPGTVIPDRVVFLNNAIFGAVEW